MINKYIIIFLLILFANPSDAQSPYFKKYNPLPKSSNPRVNLVHQDLRGIIYIGTETGLVLYDGIGFNTISGSEELNVKAICNEQNNGLLIGTGKGNMFLLINDSLSEYKKDQLRIESPITGICYDKQGRIWVSTYGEGLYCIEDEQITKLDSNTGLEDDYIYTILKDKNEGIWIGSDAGLTHVGMNKDIHNSKNYSMSHGLPDNIVRTISNAYEGGMWIGMQEAGVCYFNDKTETFSTPETFKDWKYGSVNHIISIKNEIWIGTDKHFIIDYEYGNTQRFRPFHTDEKLISERVNQMMRDREGNIWVAGASDLIFSPGERIEILKSVQDHSFKNVQAVLPLKNGKILLSDDGKLIEITRFPDGSTTYKNILSNLSKHHFISLYQDKTGIIWAGSFGQGLVLIDLDNSSNQILTIKNGLPNENIFSIKPFRNTIQIATLSGIYSTKLLSSIHTPVQFQQLPKSELLQNKYMYHIQPVNDSEIWYASDGEGVIQYKNGRYQQYGIGNTLPGSVCYSIASDKSGNIWFASPEHGLVKFNGITFSVFKPEIWKENRTISGLVSDRSGNLIIIHKEGFSILEPLTQSIHSYNSISGFDNFDPDLNSFGVDANGMVWIGSRKGLIQFNPETDQENPTPGIVINKTQIFLIDHHIDENTVLSYDQNYITISYFGLYYSDPTAISYKYKLEGLSDNWVTTGDRSVSFPNLAPGTYVFRVKVLIDGQESSSQEAVLQFIIDKPYYKKNWFISLLLLCVSTMIILIIRYRDKRFKLEEKRKNEQVLQKFETLRNQINPHFLFNSFNTLISVIEEDKEKAVEYVEHLSDYFREILTYRDVDKIDLETELKLLQTYIYLQKKRYGNNIELNLNIEPEKLTSLVPPLVLQMLVENAIKHNVVSKNNRLIIDIRDQGHYLVISNNINERKLKQKGTGLGLQNILKRYQLLSKIEIKIQHNDQNFNISIPLLN